MHPLVVVPWLSEDQLFSLEKRGIIGVDLCGNGVVVAPGFCVFRSGSPNRFRASRPLKRVYDGTSSLGARVFLLKPEYKSVSEVREEVITRGGNITLSTVSKALKQLEEDVIVSRVNDCIKLLQPDKLIDRVRTNYQTSKITDVMRFKINTNYDVVKMLTKAAKEANSKLVLSGTSSADYYATMGREPLETRLSKVAPGQRTHQGT